VNGQTARRPHHARTPWRAPSWSCPRAVRDLFVSVDDVSELEARPPNLTPCVRQSSIAHFGSTEEFSVGLYTAGRDRHRAGRGKIGPQSAH